MSKLDDITLTAAAHVSADLSFLSPVLSAMREAKRDYDREPDHLPACDSQRGGCVPGCKVPAFIGALYCIDEPIKLDANDLEKLL